VLRAFVRSLFGGAPIRDANAATADAQNVLVAAIRELRASRCESHPRPRCKGTDEPTERDHRQRQPDRPA